ADQATDGRDSGLNIGVGGTRSRDFGQESVDRRVVGVELIAEIGNRRAQVINRSHEDIYLSVERAKLAGVRRPHQMSWERGCRRGNGRGNPRRQGARAMDDGSAPGKQTPANLIWPAGVMRRM